MIKHIIATAAFALPLTAPAFAEETFEAQFSYDRNASADEIYAGFRATAEQACKADMRRTSRMPIRTTYKLLAACQAELVTSAVKSVNMATLSALHERALEADEIMILARADQ